MNLNRDDTSGFRLDTLSTHRLHRTPVVKGHDILTTCGSSKIQLYVGEESSQLEKRCFSLLER